MAPVSPSSTPNSSLRYRVLAGVLLVALGAAFLVARSSDDPRRHAHAHAGAGSASGASGAFVARGPAVRLTADTGGRIVLEQLGLTLTIGADLARQGLVGVPGVDPRHRSTSVAFATNALSDGAGACVADGARGWLGTLTRYDGPSAAMADHARHTIATLDYPGFHTTYRAVTQACAARRPGTTVAGLASEKRASAELWDAIRTAQPSSR